MKNISASKYALILLFSLPAITGFTQTYTPATLNVAGGSNTINGQIFEYSIGEMVMVHTATSTNIIITQGFLQPREIGTGISDRRLADGQINVYPNPVFDLINVDANLPFGGTLQLEVYDITGKLVSRKEVIIQSGKESTTLSFSRLAAGNYVLNAVFKAGAELYHQNFKILKLE